MIPKAVFFLLLICSTTVTSKLALPKEQKQRSFSIFSVVQFPNNECVTTSDNTQRGVCLSTEDCSKNQGTQDGTCASGFGVCCSFRKSECGSTFSNNLTYVLNPGFPSEFKTTDTGVSTCTYTASTKSDICQLRFDFQTFVISGPTTVIGNNAGICEDDKFSVTGQTGTATPTVCGILSGQHMYVETGGVAANTPITFTFNMAKSATRKYQIKVSQLLCISLDKAPADCVQYFTESSGTFTSYNFQGGVYMQSQNYATCFRKNEGFCSIQFKQSVIDGKDSFDLHMEQNTPTTSISNGFTTCPLAQLQIPGGGVFSIVPGNDGYCGAFLNQAEQQTDASVVTSQATNFDVRTFSCTTVPQPQGLPCGQEGSIGFSIDYSLLPCK